jgi:hypothetical protein
MVLHWRIFRGQSMRKGDKKRSWMKTAGVL